MDSKTNDGLRKAGFFTAQRHLFLCLGPDCASIQDGEKVWEYIKARLKATGIPVMRTKAACLRICTQGPWLVVYPDGVWYSQVTTDRFDTILEEHLIGGCPVERWIAGRNPLAAEAAATACGRTLPRDRDPS